MSDSAPIRIGCLGAARITPVALVAPARGRDDVVLAAVAARDPARAAAFANEHRFERTEPSYDALIAAPDIDLIYNALPGNGHAEWSRRALQAGKHVLCEKPLAMSLAEAEAMVAGAEASDRQLIEAFHYRYHPLFAQCLSWTAQGRIGRVLRLEAHFHAPIPDRNGAEFRHWPELGGGAFMDLGSYCLSACLAVLDDEPERIEATATWTERGVDESLRAHLHFDRGVDAVLSASMATDSRREAQLTVTGERGTIRFDNFVAPQIGAGLTLTTGATVETALEDRTSTYAHQLEAVVRAIRAGATLPTAGPALLRQQRVLDAIYTAARAA